jgi:hypothetical protein
VSAQWVRRALLAIWIACFALNIVIVVCLELKGWILEDNLRKALTQLNSSYVPYVGVIVAFYFARNATTEGARERNNAAAALAIVVSLVWNGVILAFFVPLLFGKGFIEQAIRNTEFASALISWLVAPVFGFYFAGARNTERGSL